MLYFLSKWFSRKYFSGREKSVPNLSQDFAHRFFEYCVELLNCLLLQTLFQYLSKQIPQYRAIETLLYLFNMVNYFEQVISCATVSSLSTLHFTEETIFFHSALGQFFKSGNANSFFILRFVLFSVCSFQLSSFFFFADKINNFTSKAKLFCRIFVGL